MSVEAEVWNEKTVRSRKRHVCAVCFKTIPQGVDYVRVNWVGDGESGSYKMHSECNDLYIWCCCGYRKYNEPEPLGPAETYDDMLEADNRDEWNAHINMILDKYKESEVKHD